MSKSAGGQRTSQNSTTNIDQQTQDWIKQIMAAAGAAGAAGPSPLVGGATDYYSALMKGGNLGMGALSGDPNAVKTLMDPYTGQVVDATNKQWDVNDQHTMNAVNDRATAAGAFGGSRRDVATGTALSQNNLNRNSAVSGLYSSGFQDAMNRAGTLAGYGFAGAGQNANLGMGGVGNPQQWLMTILNQGYKGPMGSTSSGASSETNTQAVFDPQKLLEGLGKLLGLGGQTPQPMPGSISGGIPSGAYPGNYAVRG